MTQEQIRAQTLAEVENELTRTIAKHGLPVDYHHGMGILSEEVHELFMEIFRKDGNPTRIAAEATQVAAMACKIAMIARGRMTA